MNTRHQAPLMRCRNTQDELTVRGGKHLNGGRRYVSHQPGRAPGILSGLFSRIIATFLHVGNTHFVFWDSQSKCSHFMTIDFNGGEGTRSTGEAIFRGGNV